jgi:hypothetical protein
MCWKDGGMDGEIEVGVVSWVGWVALHSIDVGMGWNGTLDI